MPTSIAQIEAQAQAVADGLPQMFGKKGPGDGNRFTSHYMSLLNERVIADSGADVVEQVICGDTNQSVDFYVRSEKTVLEVELSLYNVHTNLERDIFKVLLARAGGEDINTLVLLGKEPAVARHEQPSSRALIGWVKRHHDLDVIIHEIRKPRA
jgi:hypothetical protein